MPGRAKLQNRVTKLTPVSRVPTPDIWSARKVIVDADAREGKLGKRRIAHATRSGPNSR